MFELECANDLKDIDPKPKFQSNISVRLEHETEFSMYTL